VRSFEIQPAAVSEGHSASIFTVEEEAKEEACLKKAICSSETSVDLPRARRLTFHGLCGALSQNRGLRVTTAETLKYRKTFFLVAVSIYLKTVLFVPTASSYETIFIC
jgi:hypothetical protein